MVEKLGVIIAGAPASGKGTQCELIREKYNLVHISTGDLLRDAVKAGSELGKTAKEFMDKGKLVPDETIIGLVKSRLAEKDCQEKGWLLDGFPRTAAQANALKQQGISPDIFLLLDIPDELLIERVIGRRSDPQTGKIYHLKYNPPENKEIEDRLVQRSDDTAEKVKVRLEQYHNNIKAVVNHYTDCLAQVNANGSKDKVFEQISAAILTRRRVRAKRIIIAGAPASGKGTQCEYIRDYYGVVHISTGDLLRDAVKAGSELGKTAKGYMDKGELVPDQVIIGIVQKRLEEKDCVERGWLLDGFPRTKAQAEALAESGIHPDIFILLNVPDELLVERVVGRRSDPQTGKIYHLKFSPPENKEIEDRLVQRSDDTKEKIVVRIQNFHKHISEISDYYKSTMVEVDGNSAKDKVFANVIAACQKRNILPPKRIIIAGAPASGKGTQCEWIKKQFNVVHISTGDLLRDAVKAGTDVGKTAKGYMDKGQLVPDDLIIDLVQQRLNQSDCKAQGWLLDGFPRTESQAEALNKAGVVPDVFILIDVPDEILVERVCGRRLDPQTGKIYHIKFSPPESKEVVDRLVQRSDDNEETIKVRIATFHKNIGSVINSYKNILKVKGNQTPLQVFAEISASLNK